MKIDWTTFARTAGAFDFDRTGLFERLILRVSWHPWGTYVPLPPAIAHWFVREAPTP